MQLWSLFSLYGFLKTDFLSDFDIQHNYWLTSDAYQSAAMLG